MIDVICQLDFVKSTKSFTGGSGLGFEKNNMNNKYMELTCDRCGNKFFRTIKQIKNNLSRGRKNYCSLSCNSKKYAVRMVHTQCTECNNQFTKEASQINKTKHHFCSRSCAATWKNRHKTSGFRRSQLEVYLISKFQKEYPHICVHPNDRELIGLELDLFLPDYKIAIEINGICHYKPIYGDEKFKKTLKNDETKRLKCQDIGVILVVIPNLWRKFTPEVGEMCWNQYVLQNINL